MAALPTRELLKLDVETRLKIIDELWDSIVDDLNDPEKPDVLPISEPTRALLDERMREYDADPTKGVRWDDLHEQLRKMT